MTKWLLRIAQFFRIREAPCEHDWRPIVVKLMAWREYKPAKQCDKCKDWQPLTEEQFYAQFGETFYAASKAARGG